MYLSVCRGFPGGSDSKYSACIARDLSLTLGGEDPLEKGMATHSSILAWRIPWRSQVDYSPWGHKESDTTEWLTLSLFTSVWRHPYKTCIVLLCPCILTVHKWSYFVTCLQSKIPWRPIHVTLCKCNSLLSPAVTSYPLSFWRILIIYNPSWTLSHPLKGHNAVGRTWTWWQFTPTWASLVADMVKNPPAMQEAWVRSLEEGMATHSSILAWEILRIEEPDRLQSMGSQRVRYDWLTKHSTAPPTSWMMFTLPLIFVGLDFSSQLSGVKGSKLTVHVLYQAHKPIIWSPLCFNKNHNSSHVRKSFYITCAVLNALHELIS